MISNCRLCNKQLPKIASIIYKNMPETIQYLSDKVGNGSGVDLKVFQCPFCGLIQLDSDSIYYYKEVIRSSGFSKEMSEFRHNQFKNFVEKYDLKNKRILEVGCGNGEYLKIMNDYCNNTYGIEYSLNSVNHCVKNNLQVTKDFLEDENTKVNINLFDSFYMMNFLEHIPEPNKILSSIYNNTTQDAIGIIEVPNFDLTISKNIFSDFSLEHLSYFTKETLELLLRLNGFEILSLQPIWYDNILSAVVRKKIKTDFSDFNTSKKTLSEKINVYLNNPTFKKISIWGAGHQSLTNILLLGYKDKISYIVDSAIPKQNKFAPVSNIPIFSPQKLNEDKVDVIIIDATSYSTEVTKTILRDFPYIKNIVAIKENDFEIIKGE